MAEARTLPEPETRNSERMWRGEQGAVEKLEEIFHSHSISLMSEEASNLTIQAQLTMELEKVSNLKANVTALYQEEERLCTGHICNKGNCNLLKYTTLITVTFDTYSTPHFYEFLKDVQARFDKNPVGADNQFDFVL